VLDGIRRELEKSPHFVGELADDVMLAVRAVVNFLQARLGHPRPYMRETGTEAKGAAAVEADLQNDLFDWLQSGALTHGLTIYEPQKVAAGRADIGVGFRDYQVIAECKRETDDSSREAMQAAYSEQAGSYDATTYPFGLVVVLDVVKEPPSTPRLDSCVWVHRHEDEGGERWLVFVRVPGRLSTPSEHTKRAKSG
jgi:hypothetical protein